MSWLQVIGAVLTIGVKLFALWFEANEETKRINKEALEDAIKAIDSRDNSKLNAAIQRMR